MKSIYKKINIRMLKTDNNIPRNIFQELIAEVVKPEDVDVESIKLHDELSPLIWNDYDMKDEVRTTLLKNVKVFIEFSNLEEYKFSDILLTGSMAGYNYTKHSDIDVHIILDFKQISEDIELVKDLLKSKKKLWSKTYPTEIKDHEIELYFQDINEPHYAIGVFSVIKNEWIKKPVKEVVDINTENIKEKASDYINKIDDLKKTIHSDSFSGEYEKLKERLKKLRKTGLEGEGVYSTENITFKILRNLGYLDELFNLKNEHIRKKLSINQ